MNHLSGTRRVLSNPIQSTGATVAVSLADMVPLLLHASETNRSWLGDFADDVVEITQDLYDVLVAYQNVVVRRAA